jgi:AcrR family transcriptional regulator
MPSDDWVIRVVRGRQELGREHSVTSQRVDLLDAMARTVAEKGYPAITVADVAERAGVSNANFLEHFPDTESCFLAAYDMGVDVLLTTVQDGIGSPERPPLDRFERLLTSYLDLLAAEPAFARTFMIEVHAAGPRAIRRRIDVLGRFTDLFCEILGPQGAGSGGLDRFSCEALVGAIDTIVTTRVAEDKVDQLPALREPLVAFVKRTLESGDQGSETAADGVSIDSPA